MNIFYIIAFIIFPLNAALFLPSAVPADGQNEELRADSARAPDNISSGSVEGAEQARKEEIFSGYSPVPVKKPGLADLSLPNAHSSIILDTESGTIMHYENGKERRPIASLTKLMTAVVVMEKIRDLDEVAVVDEDAVYIEGTKIGCPRSGYCVSPRLKVGEKITVMNLLKAMLMNSANDAAVVLAKHAAGTEENFAKLMNEKAAKLELGDTHFCTASGLDIEGRENDCYSSAYDIARIAAYSMKYDLIWDIFRLPSNMTITSIDGVCEHQILNTDVILNQIPNCLGGKTGFTPAAGRSLLLAASDATKKHKIIAVVLDDPYRWQDVPKMIDWAFSAYEWK